MSTKVEPAQTLPIEMHFAMDSRRNAASTLSPFSLPFSLCLSFLPPFAPARLTTLDTAGATDGRKKKRRPRLTTPLLLLSPLPQGISTPPPVPPPLFSFRTARDGRDGERGWETLIQYQAAVMCFCVSEHHRLTCPLGERMNVYFYRDRFFWAVANISKTARTDLLIRDKFHNENCHHFQLQFSYFVILD